MMFKQLLRLICSLWKCIIQKRCKCPNNPIVDYETDYAQYSWDKPKILYRAFTDYQYASDFVDKGKFRIGNHDGYASAKNENIRDDEEGHGIVYDESTGISHDIINCYHRYALCFAGHGICLFLYRRQYGKYVVQIDEPEQFMEILTKYLQDEQQRNSDVVKVRYKEARTISDENKSHRHAYAYKNGARFLEDREYRLVTSEGSGRQKEEHIYVDLGGPIQNARLMTCWDKLIAILYPKIWC